MRYGGKFGRSALKGVGINTGELPKLGSPGTQLPVSILGMGGVADPMTRPSPTCVTRSNLVVLRQWCTNK